MSTEKPIFRILEPDPINNSNLKDLQPPTGISHEVFDHASGILKHLNMVQQDTRPWKDVGSPRMTRQQYFEKKLHDLQVQIDKGFLPPEAMDLFVSGSDIFGYEYEPEEQFLGWRE